MTDREATMGLLAGIISSATRTSVRAAQLQEDADHLLVRLRRRSDDTPTNDDLAATVDLVRRLSILIQTHSSTVTAAHGMGPVGWGERVRRWWRRG